MAYIGTFGKAVDNTVKAESKLEHDVVGIGVGSNGEPIPKARLRHAGDVPMIVMAEFARLITTPQADKDYITQAIFYGMLEANILPEDWTAARAAMYHVDPQGLVDMAFGFYGRWAAVPFDMLHDSSGGDSPTSEPSTNSSSPTSQDSEQPEPYKSPDQKRLEEIVTGKSL